MKIEVFVGDRYKDGHGMCDRILVETNRPTNDIWRAFRSGCEIVGIDWDSESQNEEFTPDSARKMRDAGIMGDSYDGTTWRIVDSSDYMDTFFQIARLADPCLEWNEIIESYPEMNIGGYWAAY